MEITPEQRFRYFLVCSGWVVVILAVTVFTWHLSPGAQMATAVGGFVAGLGTLSVVLLLWVVRHGK